MKVLLIIPPMTQVNTPYPSTAYLTQFLRDQKIAATQKDLGLDLFHRLFNRNGLNAIKNIIEKKKTKAEFEEFFIEAFSEYENTIERVITFLQGRDPSLALRISRRALLPEGPRFAPLDEHESEISALFGEMGVQDKAKYVASLYLDDLADLIKNGVDDRFGFSHYGESLASSQSSFDFLYEGLRKTTLVDDMLIECVKDYVTTNECDVVGFSVPFPGNVYGALRAAKYIKENFPVDSSIQNCANSPTFVFLNLSITFFSTTVKRR